jgi:hypothetical protein
MASIGFKPNFEQTREHRYVRYSDRAMEAMATKFAFTAKPTEKGDRQRMRMEVMQDARFRKQLMEEYT